MAYKVTFETLGCRLNQAETATLHGAFIRKGYQVTSDIAQADLCVVNTCALTSHAASKCRSKIRSIIRANPDVCIAAVGCYAQTDTEILRSIEGIDYIVGTADKLHLAELIPEPVKLPEATVITGKTPSGTFTLDGTGYYPLHTRANVKIQEGCDFVCSFCIIPRSRGPARSRDFDDVVRECRDLACQSHREIVLTGINIGTYEDSGRGLVDLVSALSDIEGIERIRVTSIEPTTVDPALFDLMSERKFCPYLHISLQSGDDGVLQAMRRHYTASQYMELVKEFLSRVPGAGLGTDVIVGFPGENEKAFENTCRIVEEIPFTHIHVFSFSARRGTAACNMKGKVPASVVNERSEIMRRIAWQKKLAYYESMVGRTLRVLFEERESSGLYVGFSDNYVKVGVESREEIANRMALVSVDGVRVDEAVGIVLATGLIEELEPSRNLS